jgi:hypothetical protein
MDALMKISRYNIVGLLGLASLLGCVDLAEQDELSDASSNVAGDGSTGPSLPAPPPGASCAFIQRGTLGQVADSDIGYGNGPTYPMGWYPYSWTGISPYDHWSAFQFDLSPVPVGADVVLGVFTTYVMWNDTGGTVRAHRIIDAWDEATVTWSSFTNNGAITNWDPALLGSIDVLHGGYRSIDVTGLVADWHSGAVANNGLLLEEDPILLHGYAGSESSYEDQRPSLYVCWVAGDVDEPDSPPDGDGDGVPTANDCDDSNPLIGGLLYQNDMSVDTGYLATGPKLTDPWAYGGGVVSNTEGGQQALLGAAESWTDTVTFVSLSAHGSKSGCASAALECNPERFRAGVLARANVDADQDEGFHGYRCAVAFNAAQDCYDPGAFVQIAAFLDGPEDNIDSECVVGCAPNPTFDQLARKERSTQTDLLAGDSATLAFWTVGTTLVCEFTGENGEHVTASAQDNHFAAGGTGLSTLNALGDFDHVKVCQAFGTP